MKEENTKRILDLGVEIISRKGFHHLGLNELLDSAGIPKGSFYYYFNSKEDFGRKVISHYANNTLNYLQSMLLDKKKNPHERLVFMFKDRAKTYKKSAYKEGCLMGDCSNELAGQIESMQVLLEREFLAWREVFKQCIEEGQQLGEFNNNLSAVELADFVLNSWEGALSRMKATRSVKPFHLFVKYTMKVVLKP